jgi:hypothetical protein
MLSLKLIGLPYEDARTLAQVAVLPEDGQEQIGRQLLAHLQKLCQLREDIDKGIRSLDAGKGAVLDIEEFLDRLHARCSGS